MHLVIIDPKTGQVEAAKAFDTYETSLELDKFISNSIPDGRIVVAACKDDCTRRLSEKGFEFLEGLGSQEIRKLTYRDGFALIGTHGKNEVNEMKAEDKKETVSVTQVFHLVPPKKVNMLVVVPPMWKQEGTIYTITDLLQGIKP